MVRRRGWTGRICDSSSFALVRSISSSVISFDVDGESRAVSSVASVVVDEVLPFERVGGNGGRGAVEGVLSSERRQERRRTPARRMTVPTAMRAMWRAGIE
jgi:hypothetical protein